MDLVEELCEVTECSAYDIFYNACCVLLKMSKERMEMLFEAYVTEDYIPIYVKHYCCIYFSYLKLEVTKDDSNKNSSGEGDSV